MFINFSPVSYLFLVIYFFSVFLMVSMNSFFSIWLIMEASMFILMGVLFSYFMNNFSHLLFFFIIQSISSLSILFFFCMGENYLVLSFLFLKMGVFPFYSWFFMVMFYLDSFSFFLLSIIQKIPSLLLMSFMINLSYSSYILLMIFLLLNAFFSSYQASFSYNLRSIMILSSIYNNSWLVLSLLISVYLTLLYLLLYGVSLFLLLYFHNFYSFDFSKSFLFKLTLVSMSGLPPFPLFFIKLLILFNIGVYFPLLTAFLLLFSLMMIYSYSKIMMGSYTELNSSTLTFMNNFIKV